MTLIEKCSKKQIMHTTQKNSRQIILISSYCDNEEKIAVLINNIKKIKNVGFDVAVISPILLYGIE